MSSSHPSVWPVGVIGVLVVVFFNVVGVLFLSSLVATRVVALKSTELVVDLVGIGWCKRASQTVWRVPVVRPNPDQSLL